MTPQQLYTQLLTRPANILPYYQITIRGATTDGWKRFQFVPRTGVTNLRPGRKLGKLRTHRAQAFYINYTNQTPQNSWATYNVRMQTPGNYNTGAIAGYRLPNAGGPALMLTGQLTGCTFCCLHVTGGVLVAHLQPTGGGAFNLETTVTANGRFAGHLTSSLDGVYGKGSYNQAAGLSAASVVGRRVSGAWEIYAQEYNNFTHTVLNTTRIL